MDILLLDPNTTRKDLTLGSRIEECMNNLGMAARVSINQCEDLGSSDALVVFDAKCLGDYLLNLRHPKIILAVPEEKAKPLPYVNVTSLYDLIGELAPHARHPDTFRYGLSGNKLWHASVYNGSTHGIWQDLCREAPGRVYEYKSTLGPEDTACQYCSYALEIYKGNRPATISSNVFAQSVAVMLSLGIAVPQAYVNGAKDMFARGKTKMTHWPEFGDEIIKWPLLEMQPKIRYAHNAQPVLF
ncbi:MAG: hypothetical protein HGA85_01415 [Nanoarchaeota archaeon]|nr:hypothetical protein [Nanoarchaeota archaeon]